MGTFSLPAIQDVPKLTEAERAVILDSLFEPSEELRTLSLGPLQEQSFQDYHHLILHVKSQLDALLHSTSDLSRLDHILGSHPRLGEKKIESAQSQSEQAQLQSSDSNEARQLMVLNSKYEETFPSLRYVVFVNGRPRSVILEDMQARIDRKDKHRERISAIEAMCDIALDRSRKLS